MQQSLARNKVSLLPSEVTSTKMARPMLFWRQEKRVNARNDSERVRAQDLVLAAVLLVGVLTVGYGFFYLSSIAFYLGMFTIVGGVIFGAIRIVTR